jgi:hypothetical protein
VRALVRIHTNHHNSHERPSPSTQV